MYVGCAKFHQYIYGHPVTVYTDHKPLQVIFKRQLSKVPVRIARMLFGLKMYDLTVKWVPGKRMNIPDTLSRAAQNQEVSADVSHELDVQVHEFIVHVPMSGRKWEEFQEETVKDLVLKKLTQTIQEGWPKEFSLVPEILKPYWNFREELVVSNGIVFKGDKIVVPSSLREVMLKLLHESHQGVEKTRSRARQLLYWPNINEDIRMKVSQCEQCQLHQRRNTKEPQKPHLLASRVWQKTACDLFEFG